MTDSAAAPTPYTPPGPLHGAALIIGSVALATATFMNVLDTSIANVSIPAIAGDLGVSPNQGTWVITSFAVATGICLPLTGWLAQRFGAVRLFVTSVLLFTLASWLCAIAPTIETLILFRIIQGAVAGPMVPLSQSLLLSSYPKEKSGTALAMWTITSLVAPVVGPVLGGWITDNIHWAWIFYINIPVGFFAASAVWFLYRKRETPTQSRPVDGLGLVLLVVWIGAFQIVLDKGKELDWFASPQIVALALVAAIGFLFFLIWELTEEHPVVDLSLFGNRNFTTATLTVSIGYSMFFGNLVLLPLWLQQYMGYTPTLAGLAMAPVGILAMILSPIVGKNVTRVDPRIFGSLGFGIFALVLWMRSQFNTEADFAVILLPTIIQGAAIAFFFIPLFNLALSSIPSEKFPSASGLVNFVRITAGAFGASVTTTLWEDRTALHHAYLVEYVDRQELAMHPTLSGLRAAVPQDLPAFAGVDRLIEQQAAMLAANDIFAFCAGIFLLLTAAVWLARPDKPKAVVKDSSGH